MSLVTTTSTAASPLPADVEALMRLLKMVHAGALALIVGKPAAMRREAGMGRPGRLLP